MSGRIPTVMSSGTALWEYNKKNIESFRVDRFQVLIVQALNKKDDFCIIFLQGNLTHIHTPPAPSTPAPPLHPLPLHLPFLHLPCTSPPISPCLGRAPKNYRVSQTTFLSLNSLIFYDSPKHSTLWENKCLFTIYQFLANCNFFRHPVVSSSIV